MTARETPLPGLGIVVTGAASGIGEATARLLAREGAAVVLVDRDRDRLGAVARELAESGAGVSCIVADLSDPLEAERLCAEATERPGGIGVLVHCAGIVHPGPLEQTEPEWIARQVAVNLLGSIYVTRAFLPHFRARGAGHVIMMGSLGGIAPMPNETIYCATKFGVRGFGLSLALELRHTPIHVTVVCPDSVLTPQLREEAVGGGSPVAFTSDLLTAHEVARAIRSAILRPRREVLVPAFRGALIRALNLVPGVYAASVPALERRGLRGRARYLATAPAGTRPPDVPP